MVTCIEKVSGKEGKTMEENSSISFWKIAVTILLAAILIGVVFLIARQGKSVVNEKLEVINTALSENQSDGYSMYENTTISGHEVLNLIKKAVSRGDCIAIRVITGMNRTGTNTNGKDYNYTLAESTDGVKITKITSADSQPEANQQGKINDENYVNPYGVFRCEIKKDANGVTVALVLTQIG